MVRKEFKRPSPTSAGLEIVIFGHPTADVGCSKSLVGTGRKLKFKENKEFPHYGLYYYYEGSVQQNIKYLKLRGAPVLFVPGNAGSFKQVRSLASVALQKALDNERNIQLNYFAIDFKEQLSGFYGGYLEDQKMFLKLCIQVVSNIYEKNKSVIIIGHSMGGKVAQAVLEQRGDFTKINSIIFISSPLDIPVINLDYEIQKFYVNNEKFLSINRERYLAHNETNTCVDLYQNVSYFRSESSLMENILMISIGGGNRDLMVQESLTMSKYSDIHAMTSSIPKVWLSCDHLSSVWCLQLVKVINRFIFAVATVDSRNDVFYLDEKSLRVQAAINYFVKPLNRHKVIELYFNNNYESVWDEQSKIVYGKLFKNGLRHYYNQLLTIHKYKDYKKLFMEVTGLDDNNWLFACLETFHEVSCILSRLMDLPRICCTPFNCSASIFDDRFNAANECKLSLEFIATTTLSKLMPLHGEACMLNLLGACKMGAIFTFITAKSNGGSGFKKISSIRIDAA
uniref:GPI inositol-deacylase n=1 Tax=Glossina pallidipes TaxID=7398 RepID=A0A1B0AEI1_GLOPL